MKKLTLATLCLGLGLVAVGCSGKEDIGDANKNPPKGTAVAPNAINVPKGQASGAPAPKTETTGVTP